MKSFDLPYSFKITQIKGVEHQNVVIKYAYEEDFNNYVLDVTDTVKRSVSIGERGMVIYKVNTPLYCLIKTNFPIVETDDGLVIQNHE